MFLKTVIKQGEKIIELDKENTAIKNENRDLRFENEELYDHKKEAERLHDRIIIELLNLQEINRLGIS